ncbi:hypothetical protein EVB53_102 [Rhizobium phage RHph_Y60]|nr:hypothetical protein EVB53_102 [Rhizobium phage RHph_Y60]
MIERRFSAAAIQILVGHNPGVVIIDEDVSPAEPVEEPRVDPRRSRVTARGGRSDDWKGRQYGRQVRS